MIRSMTGYGSASLELVEGSVRAELRSVNSRHLRLSFQLPAPALAWEPDLRSLIGSKLKRGHADVWLGAEAHRGNSEKWELDPERVQGWLDAFEELRVRYGIEGRADLGLLVAAGGMLREASAPGLEWLEYEHVESVMSRALERLVEMREGEGARLDRDIRARLAAIRVRIERTRALAPERLLRERDRLRAAVKELAEGLELGEERVAREVALVADRWDIGEEMVRATAHLDAFEDYLEKPSGEAVGKRLSFLVQELQRELNTMGAKANDAEISRSVVEMKNEVESLKEQVENVE